MNKDGVGRSDDFKHQPAHMCKTWLRELRLSLKAMDDNSAADALLSLDFKYLRMRSHQWLCLLELHRTPKQDGKSRSEEEDEEHDTKGQATKSADVEENFRPCGRL